jgi:hypothetical protein
VGSPLSIEFLIAVSNDCKITDSFSVRIARIDSATDLLAIKNPYLVQRVE